MASSADPSPGVLQAAWEGRRGALAGPEARATGRCGLATWLRRPAWHHWRLGTLRLGSRATCVSAAGQPASRQPGSRRNNCLGTGAQQLGQLRQTEQTGNHNRGSRRNRYRCNRGNPAAAAGATTTGAATTGATTTTSRERGEGLSRLENCVMSGGGVAMTIVMRAMPPGAWRWSPCPTGAPGPHPSSRRWRAESAGMGHRAGRSWRWPEQRNRVAPRLVRRLALDGAVERAPSAHTSEPVRSAPRASSAKVPRGAGDEADLRELLVTVPRAIPKSLILAGRPCRSARCPA